MSGVRFLERDKNKNIHPENIECKGTVSCDRVETNLLNITGGLDMNGFNISDVGNLELDSLTRPGSQTIEVKSPLILLNKNLKITDDTASTMSVLPGVHVQNTGNANLWLESDTEGNFTGDPIISMSNFQNELLFQIETTFGPSGCARYTSSQAGGDVTCHEFFTGVCSNTGKNTLNSIISRTKRFEIGPSKIDAFVDLDMNTDDILNVNNITATNYNITNPVLQRSILSLDLAIVAGTIQTLNSAWTVLSSSTRVSVNASTGTFTPATGLYAMTFQATTTASMPPETEVGLQLVRVLPSAVVVYQSVVRTSDLFDGDNNVEAAMFENLTGYFFSGETYQLRFKCSNAATFNFQVVISRIL